MLWRLLADVKSISAAVARASTQLTPALAELASTSQATAERASAIQARWPSTPPAPTDGPDGVPGA